MAQPRTMPVAEVRQLLQQAAASADADDMLRAGAAALRAGAQAEAAGPVREALGRHPDHPQLWHLLGLLHRDLQDLAVAVEAFARAAELAPDDAGIAHGHACVSHEAGLPAIELFERAVRLAPADPAIRLRLAAVQIVEGRTETAISGLEQALAERPGWVEAHAALARVRWAEGDHENFAASFERALQASPRDLALWRAYVETLLHDKLHERALAVITRARSAAGPNPTFDAGEAIALSELGRLDAAAEAFQRVAQLQSMSLLVAYLRFLIRSGRIREAAEVAERNVSQGGNWIWPYLSITWRLIGDPRWEWLEGDPGFIGVYDIADALPDLDALAGRLRTLHRAAHHPLGQSLRTGTQTEGDLLSRLEPEIRQLRQALVATIERHVAQLPPARPGHPLLVAKRSPILFSGSWSVRLQAGGRHVEHIHPAGWISSALYIALPDEQARGAGEAGWLSLGEASELGVELAPIRLVEPKPGRLVLFPSTMWHGTRPFAAGERLTVAFDVRRPR